MSSVWCTRLTSDLSLNQEVPLCSDVFEESRHINGVLPLHLLQHAVQDDVGARPAHAGAAEGDKKVTRSGHTGAPRNQPFDGSHLQWTTDGPAPSVRAPDDLRTKLSSGRASSGTPMSGHWV